MLKSKFKNKFSLLLCTVLLTGSISTIAPVNAKAASYTNYTYSDTRYTVGTIYLSPSQVASLKASITNASRTQSILIGVFTTFTTANPWIGSASTIASAFMGGPSFNETVNSAYYQSKGMYLTITDSVNCHTSYSVQYIATVAN